MNKKIVRYILLGLVAVLIIIQFFPIDKTNPPADPAKDFITLESPPENVKAMLKASCYDCHSNHSVYPWYTNIAPVSWWIKGHINNGRKHLNFSAWGDYKQKRKDHKYEEIVEFVEEKRMPILSYTWGHPEARMSEEDREVMVSWAKSKMAD